MSLLSSSAQAELCVLKVVPRIAVRSVFDILSDAIFEEEFLFPRVHGSYCHFIELFDLTKRKEKKSKEFPSFMPHRLPFFHIHKSKAAVSWAFGEAHTPALSQDKHRCCPGRSRLEDSAVVTVSHWH